MRGNVRSLLRELLATLMTGKVVSPKVSVSILTFNHGAWLGECLDSVLDQDTKFPFEVIVGDDASTDGVTREILVDYARKFEGKLMAILREKNMGITNNYIDVTAHCRGEYIAYIDGDDRMLPGKLQKQADFLDTHPECSIVAHEMRVFNTATNDTVRARFHSGVVPEIADMNFLVMNGCYFAHSSKMYRKSAIISSQRPSLTIDFFWHVEQAYGGKIGYIAEVLGEYRKSLNSLSDIRGSLIRQTIRGHLDAYQRALELGCEPEAVFQGRVRFKYIHAMEMLHHGMYDQFKDLIRIDREERKFATLRHKVVAAMSVFPTPLRWIKKIFVRAQGRK